MRTFLKYWFPVLIYAILIFSVSGVPGDDIPSVFHFQDVLFHVLEYAGLAFLLSRAWKQSLPGWKFERRLVICCLLCMLYAASDEFHQSFIPNRDASLLDFVWDTSGIIIAAFFYR